MAPFLEGDDAGEGDSTRRCASLGNGESVRDVEGLATARPQVRGKGGGQRNAGEEGQQ
jgi:hypothetical protein